MASNLEKLKAARLLVMGTLADEDMLAAARAAQARIEAVIAEVERQAEGVGHAALTLVYLDYAIKQAG
jgi:hypothetical protein